MFYLPLYHRLENEPCLVIGGGTTALRKINWLVRAEAEVTVVAKKIDSKVQALADDGRIAVRTGSYEDELIEPGLTLVVCATDDDAVSQRAYARARQCAVPINCVDRPDLCTVVFPSIVDRHPVIVAISTMGAAPALARTVRGWIEARLPAGLGNLAELSSDLRDRVRRSLPTTALRRRFWDRVFASRASELAMAGKVDEARSLIEGDIDTTDEEPQGSIALIGAGPGDPELITLKGLRLLQTADVILYDKLANPQLLDMARRDADTIFVGKEGPKPDDPPDRPTRVNQQQAITQQMIELAKAGNAVVRLKGGDPFIYGRGGEELHAALEAGVDIQIVPGITAALGAASYAGIPLTHRNVSQSVRFVTGHRQDDDINLDWPEIARSEQTLVVYMGLVGLERILARLIEVGRSAETPAVLVENATLPEQREIYGSIGTLAEEARKEGVTGPTTAIVGEVVALGPRGSR